MCYSKTILKTEATIYPRKTNFLEILANQASFYFKKLISKEKNHQKESQHQKNP